MLKISRREYWQNLAHILSWLDNYDALRSQALRVTDTRLSEWMPPGSIVHCKRCGKVLQMVPCIECVLNSETADLVKDIEVKDTWHLQWKLTTDRHDVERTEALPGTAAKLEVMAQRFMQGLSVFHPQDPILPNNHLR